MEILIAVAVFATGFVILLGVITSAAHAGRVAEDGAVAQQVAEQVLEDERSLILRGIPPVNLGPNNVTNTTVSYIASGTQVTMTFTYEVADATQSGSGMTFHDLAVNVTWQDDAVSNHSVKMETGVSH